MSIVTEKELVPEVKLCQRSLVGLRQKRLIPYMKIGRSVRYDLDAVKAALSKLTVKELS